MGKIREKWTKIEEFHVIQIYSLSFSTLAYDVHSYARAFPVQIDIESGHTQDDVTWCENRRGKLVMSATLVASNTNIEVSKETVAWTRKLRDACWLEVEFVESLFSGGDTFRWMDGPRILQRPSLQRQRRVRKRIWTADDFIGIIGTGEKSEKGWCMLSTSTPFNVFPCYSSRSPTTEVEIIPIRIHCGLTAPKGRRKIC